MFKIPDNLTVLLILGWPRGTYQFK